LAPLLVNLSLQRFLNYLQSQNIRCQAHADDIAVHLRTSLEATQLTTALKEYEAASGARLN